MLTLKNMSTLVIDKFKSKIHRFTMYPYGPYPGF